MKFITLSLVSRSPSPEPRMAAAAKPPDLLVIMPVRDWVCARCTGTGGLLTMDDAGPLCMTCADLDHLVFFGAGDAALTRRAKQASALSAVVVRWSRSRKSGRCSIKHDETATQGAHSGVLPWPEVEGWIASAGQPDPGDEACPGRMASSTRRGSTSISRSLLPRISRSVPVVLAGCLRALSQLGGKADLSRWPGPRRRAHRPHGKLHDKGGNYLIVPRGAGELHKSPTAANVG